jgi:hypothetical protein
VKGYKFGKARESGLDPYEIIRLLESEVLKLANELSSRDERKRHDKEDEEEKRFEVLLNVRCFVQMMVGRDTEKQLTAKDIRDGIREAFDKEIKKKDAAPYGRPLPGSDRRLDELLKPILEEFAPYTLGKKGRPKINK